MAISKKQQASVTKYISGHYDQISVRVKKGEREKIQQHAEDHGESLNGFITRAISETMVRDDQKGIIDN